MYDDKFRQLCCEQNPQSYVKLNQNTLSQTEIKLGKYQEVAPIWLDSLNIAKKYPALGFVYCDPNGAKDLIEGIQFFKQLTQDPRFRCLDFIFHWSMAGYSRNKGKGNSWAQEPIMEVVDGLVSLKKFAFMREPLDKHQWVFMHMMNTDKVNPVWKTEHVMKYADWLNQYSHKFDGNSRGQLSFFDQPDQGTLLTQITPST